MVEVVACRLLDSGNLLLRCKCARWVQSLLCHCVDVALWLRHLVSVLEQLVLGKDWTEERLLQVAAPSSLFPRLVQAAGDDAGFEGVSVKMPRELPRYLLHRLLRSDSVVDPGLKIW